MSETRVYEVEYVYGSYSGIAVVIADENADEEQIVAIAKRQLQPFMSLPMAAESFRVKP